MKNIRQLSIALLIITAAIALYGGIMLVYDSTGQKLGLSLEDIKGTFLDYGIPGWILIIAIGGGSIVTTIISIQHKKVYPYFIIANGILLLLWILIQIIIVQETQLFQLVFGLIGLAFILLGNQLRLYVIHQGEHHPAPPHQFHSKSKRHKRH